MIYLILTFICLLLLFFWVYLVTTFSFSKFYAKQNFYESIDDNKNFVLLYFVKYSNLFVPLLKIIKIKIFIDYIKKLDK